MSQSNLQRIQATLSELSQSSSEQPTQNKQSEDQTVQQPSPLISVPLVDPVTVRPFSTGTETSPPLTLPHLNSIQPKQPRQILQPGLSLGILKEIEKVLTTWQAELQQLTLNIQDVQLEGPIIDGWLESQLGAPVQTEHGFLQHAEISQISQYVNSMEDRSFPSSPDHSRTIYRLCTLDADGHVQSQPCPSEQIPQVSLAIARHQKLRQLLSRKHYLEFRLSQLAENLVTIHSYLQEPNSITPSKEPSEPLSPPGVG
ncbi:MULTISPECIES: hypothetical protein [unclassified Leptolyngbya]|uniref:hypothetical protein n=1 Tax=unclassified Leptolyngbya TaxID=2650499 RepID=UPI001686E032|nr:MULTISPECIES: hypothetical protein [unclassified Leptolyngbya]MBD1909694.1 hypothetical protein [Leptolyngbya sp. FACHB-8]MBD2155960.1 hypothetical protein [Leptolyngbya sp. FACHB-16]